MQNEIKAPMDLLDGKGRITNEGWARHPYWNYDRARIKANALRIKEWDYYIVMSQDQRFGVGFTISDLGYAGLYAAAFLDFATGFVSQADTLSVLPLGKTSFPAGPDDDGRIAFGDKKLSLEFVYENGTRTLNFKVPGIRNAEGEQGLEGSITLAQPAGIESMNIATSWAEKRTAFYYNRKVNCMPASGGFSIGNKRYALDPKKDTGTLDWGRGRWTYRNRWYWGSASGYVDGHSFGWNIGYGFTDRTPASENVLFYDGKVHKLDQVEFIIDTSDYMKPWRFTSSDGRFEMDFKPIVDRSSAMKLGPIRSDQHQVFGEFTGTAILDDGTKIRLDRFLAFAEDVYNCY